jgi:nitrate reductase gamma subunit
MDYSDISDLGVVLAAMAGVFVVLSVIALALFLIGCIARYKYLKIRSYENAWLAFIPIANIWAIVEATYGSREKINIYGWDAPAIVLKLWPIVSYALALVINIIPMIGSILSMLLYVLNIAVMVMIFRDVMEQMDKPQEMVTGVIAVIFRIVAHIMMISASSRFQPGQQDWKTDNRELNSQTVTDGPLSFLNGKI